MSKLARMHTAEHILSAVMRKFYDAPHNLEFHISEKKTKCDYEVPAALNQEDISRIEELVNTEIARDYPISLSVVKRELASGYDLWKVPPDVDEIRIVRIGDFDTQPCRGEHVSSTSEVGKFRISSWEERENGRVRIRFKVE